MVSKKLVEKTIKTLRKGTDLMVKSNDRDFRFGISKKQNNLLDIVQDFFDVLNINNKIKEIHDNTIEALRIGYFGMAIDNDTFNRIDYAKTQKYLIDLIEGFISHVKFED